MFFYQVIEQKSFTLNHCCIIAKFKKKTTLHSNIWHSYQTFLFFLLKTLTKTPTYNLTSPASATSMAKGDKLTVLFETWMPYPSPDMAAEAFSLHSDPNNNHLQVVSLRVKAIGQNFDGTTVAPQVCFHWIRHPNKRKLPWKKISDNNAFQVDLSKITSTGVLCNTSWSGSRRVRVALPTTLTNKGIPLLKYTKH